MNLFVLGFYIFSIASYFLFLLLPTQNRLLFSAILFLLLILIARKIKVNFEIIKIIPTSYYLVLSLYLAVGAYGMYLRWLAEPYGMWDAWVIWNLKAKTIANEFLFSEKVNFSNDSWLQRDYPLALSLIHSSIAIMIGRWSELISYFIQILFLFVIGGIFLLYAYSKKFHFSYLLLALLILAMNGQFLNIASDLCSEMALSCFLVMIYYTVLKEPGNELVQKESPFKIGLLLAAPVIIKNEGALHSIIILFLYSIILFWKNRRYILKRIFILLLPFFFLVVVVIAWKYQGNQLLPKDFLSNNKNQPLSLELILNKLAFIQIYLFNFHFSMMKGIFLIAIVSALLVKRIETIILSIHIFLILIAYSLVFIFSTQDISWHLYTAFVRIHSAMIAPVLFLAWISLTTLINNKSKL